MTSVFDLSSGTENTEEKSSQNNNDPGTSAIESAQLILEPGSTLHTIIGIILVDDGGESIFTTLFDFDSRDRLGSSARTAVTGHAAGRQQDRAFANRHNC